MCVYCVYLLCIYKYKHIQYIFRKYLHVYIYITDKYILYINIIFFLNINMYVCVCIYIYIYIYIYRHNKYTQYTHIYYVNKNFYLDAINRD